MQCARKCYCTYSLFSSFQGTHPNTVNVYPPEYCQCVIVNLCAETYGHGALIISMAWVNDYQTLLRI